MTSPSTNRRDRAPINAGLGREQPAEQTRPRPRRPGPRSGGRALADRTLGLAAPAHPQLDDAASWMVVPRPRDPRATCPPADSCPTSRSTPPPFDAPVQGSTWVEDVSLHEGRSDAGYTRQHKPGILESRGTSVVATGPWGRPHVRPDSSAQGPPWCPPARSQPRHAAARAACWWSEHRLGGADRRRARPVGSRCRPGWRRPHPDPASLPGDGDLRGWSGPEAGANDRRQQRSGTTAG
jgi:hypothetical protein